MKYILTIALMFVAIAQTQAQKGITIEAKGGVNFAKYEYDYGAPDRSIETKSNEGRTGFHIGAIVGIPITETYSFETGLIFSQKGGKSEKKYVTITEGGSSDVIFKEDFKINYLDIPLHAKGTFPINEGMSIFGILGPTISFGISGKIDDIDYDKLDDLADSDESVDNNLPYLNRDIKFGSKKIIGEEGRRVEEGDDLKSLDFGFTFGAGVQLDKLSIGLNYDLGLTNLSNNETKKDDGSTETYSSKNRVFRISIGYRLF